MTSVWFLFFYFICSTLAQYAPEWETHTLSCDTSFTDRFPPGARYAVSNFGSPDYYRFYRLTTAYDTKIRRDIVVSTCNEAKTGNIWVWPEQGGGNGANLRPYYNPWEALGQRPPNYESEGHRCDDCPNGQIGRSCTIRDVPAGEWMVGFFHNDPEGGKYKVSVTCLNPSSPPSATYKSNNVTKQWSERQTWIDRGSKAISCDANAYGTVSLTETKDFYQYEVTDWAQKITFTTCDPDTYFKHDPFSYSAYTSIPYSGSTAYDYDLEVHTWDFEARGWKIRSSYNNGNSFAPGCTAVTIGGYDNSDHTVIVDVSPGTYYVGINATTSGISGAYVLSMICWDNDAVQQASAGKDYTVATYVPTPSPNTAAPTQYPTAAPTMFNTTSSEPTTAPTKYPTETFTGTQNKARKTNDMGDIACGIHRHGVLERKRSNFYTFEVLASSTRYTFDTCLNDGTNFTSCVKLYRLGTGSFNAVTDGASCDYCNVITGIISTGTYFIEIYGKTDDEEGEYVLRMGCGLYQYSQVAAVSMTAEPTPSPTGIASIDASRNGEIVGDISCGIIVAGDISASQGDFHKFTIIGGGIDWVRFSTCDETEFENYLFVYDYYNQTGHEYFYYGRDNSIGFHYDDSTTCNSLVMNDLTPGVYYVRIDGFNYYFDHGAYTINMECSDSSKVRGASSYNEYTGGFKWWWILLIVLGGLICCLCVGFGICFYVRKKQTADGGGGDSGNGNTGTELQNTGGE